MKTNLAVIALFLIIASSCSYPNYLPSSGTIDVNEYGSLVRLYGKKIHNFGELIAIDTANIVVLDNKTQKCVSVPLSNVSDFSLIYARPVNYVWTIPVFSVLTLSHGMFAAITLPINLGTTIIVTSSSDNSFRYSRKDMTFEKLKMFARFPGGIPAGVELVDIK